MPDFTRRQILAHALRDQIENSSVGATLKKVASGVLQIAPATVRGMYLGMVSAAFPKAGIITQVEYMGMLGRQGAAAWALPQGVPQTPAVSRTMMAGLLATIDAEYVGSTDPEPTPPAPVVTEPVDHTIVPGEETDAG